MKASFLSFLAFILFSLPLQAGELNGVSMPDSIDVNGQNLVLNGMALRKKAFIKVYVAGLYLPSQQSSADTILDADTARSLSMHFVRSVGGEKICGAWKEGLAANTPDASEDLKAKFNTLCKWMADAKDGDEYIFRYLPGTGTEVWFKSQKKGVIESKAFADALYRCWIGQKPGPGEAFKQALLGAK